MTTREQLEKVYSNSRANLLLVIAFTTVNVILAMTNSDMYFLFSASIPMFLLYIGAEYSVVTDLYTFAMPGIVAAFGAIAFFWGLLAIFQEGRRLDGSCARVFFN